MGRLIDADVLSEEIDSWGMNDYEPLDFIDAIDDAPTVEAIPKADYENRLKDDLRAILVELQLEIEEIEKPLCHSATYAKGCVDKGRIEGLIQQKINSLKENIDGNK
jgi:hypothetical protein